MKLPDNTPPPYFDPIDDWNDAVSNCKCCAIHAHKSLRLLTFGNRIDKAVTQTGA